MKVDALQVLITFTEKQIWHKSEALNEINFRQTPEGETKKLRQEISCDLRGNEEDLRLFFAFTVFEKIFQHCERIPSILY